MALVPAVFTPTKLYERSFTSRVCVRLYCNVILSLSLFWLACGTVHFAYCTVWFAGSSWTVHINGLKQDFDKGRIQRGSLAWKGSKGTFHQRRHMHNMPSVLGISKPNMGYAFDGGKSTKYASIRAQFSFQYWSTGTELFSAVRAKLRGTH